MEEKRTRIIEKDLKLGKIELQVDNLDDLWQLYNIIEPEDLVFAQTFRRIRQKKEMLRPDSGEKVKMYLGILVKGVEFHAFSNRLRVRGLIKKGPMDLITLDSHHTINIEINSRFLIKKEKWSKFHLIRLEDAVAESEAQQILIAVIDEREVTIGLVTSIGIKIITHFQENIPGKRFKITYHEQSLQKFYQEISTVLVENNKMYNVQAIIVAGPGFAKEHFSRYLREKVPEIEVPISIENASNASKSGIYEVIKRGATSKILGKLRLFQESDLIDEVLRRLGKNQNDITYGFNEIKNLAQTNAIDKLLLTDVFLREQSIEMRKEIDEVIRNVEKNKGKIHIISTLHPAGEQLNSLSGIAALLRFPISQN
ncbi:MAG: mRNA surveillance protein pelota [Candidatus Helarchaeota archaeon]|nr:mRNA surveillance protein pelota [Candidatus Helarchaeota archaeon]